MKALVYHGPGERGWDTVDDPTIIDPTDAIVRIDTSTICGTDLHILKGDVPETTPGTILGHEAVGTIQEVGAGVSTVAPGDRVLMSCVSSCGRCRFCKEGRYGQCLGGGGWIFGHTINGVQAEYARVPFADNSVYKVPAQLTDEQVLFLADILPTSFEVGVLNGMVSPGDVVAIVGAGPIGLAAILTSRSTRRGGSSRSTSPTAACESATRFGADITINNGARGCPRHDHGADRRPRCGRRLRGGRRAGDVRARDRSDPTGRTCREHRRARQGRDACIWRSCGFAM